MKEKGIAVAGGMFVIALACVGIASVPTTRAKFDDNKTNTQAELDDYLRSWNGVRPGSSDNKSITTKAELDEYLDKYFMKFCADKYGPTTTPSSVAIFNSIQN